MLHLTTSDYKDSLLEDDKNKKGGGDIKTCRFIIQLKMCNFDMQECMSFFINQKNREISVQ